MYIYLSVCMTLVLTIPTDQPWQVRYQVRTVILEGRDYILFWPYYHLGYNVSSLLPYLFWSRCKETLFSLKNIDNLKSYLPCTNIHSSICRHIVGVMATDFSPNAAIVSTVALRRCILLASPIFEVKIGLSLPIANSARPIFSQNHI